MSEQTENLRSQLSIALVVMSNLPEYPGYNGSALTIDDVEADNIYKAISEARDRIESLEAQLQECRALLEMAAPHVRASAGAAHMMDGFKPMRHPIDEFIERIDTALSKEKA